MIPGERLEPVWSSLFDRVSRDVTFRSQEYFLRDSSAWGLYTTARRRGAIEEGDRGRQLRRAKSDLGLRHTKAQGVLDLNLLPRFQVTTGGITIARV